MDNFTSFNRPVLDEDGLVVRLALRPQTRLPLVAVRDIGFFAALAFSDPGRYLGQRLVIAGDCLTGPQIAEAFSEACGLPARFHQLPNDQLRAFDEQVARMDREPPDEPDLTALRALHPALLTLPAWLQATARRNHLCRNNCCSRPMSARHRSGPRFRGVEQFII